MGRSRRSLVIAAGLVAIISMLAACSGSATPTATTAPATTAASGGDAATPQAELITVLGVKHTAPGPTTPGVAAEAAEQEPLPGKYGQAVGPYIMAMETIASAAPSVSGLQASPGCTVDSVFKRGMRVVFRFQIYDMKSGMVITDRDGATTTVSLPQGNDIEAYFAKRGGASAGPDSPFTWATVWNVPDDYPLGAVPVTVTLKTKDGTSSIIKPMDGDGRPMTIVD